MSNTVPKILAFAGSTRQGSFNKKLIRIAVDLVLAAGVEVTYIDLKVYPMPLYDGDLEKEIILPESAIKIRSMMKSHQGFLISAPEYNSSISGVLKNTIDWASRPQPDEEDLICFKHKIVGLMSASPGKLGGIRGLVTVRSIFGNIGSIVTPMQVCIPNAHEKFTDDGNLKIEAEQKMLATMIQEYVTIVKRLS